jgi:hypothetical protein
MSQNIDKGPAILILLLVAFAISGIGVSLEGKDMPHKPGAAAVISTANAQDPQVTESVGSADPSTSSQYNRQVAKANGNPADSVGQTLDKGVAN